MDNKHPDKGGLVFSHAFPHQPYTPGHTGDICTNRLAWNSGTEEIFRGTCIDLSISCVWLFVSHRGWGPGVQSHPDCHQILLPGQWLFRVASPKARTFGWVPGIQGTPRPKQEQQVLGKASTPSPLQPPMQSLVLSKESQRPDTLADMMHLIGNAEGHLPWHGVWWTPRREGWAVGMKETEREQRRAGVSEWVMCNVPGSAHYKMILVNYLEPAIYRMAGVDSRMGCLPFSLRHRETEGWSSPGQSLDDESGVAPLWGSLQGVAPGWAGLPVLETAGIQCHSGSGSRAVSW